jgi:hypothetical protein
MIKLSGHESTVLCFIASFPYSTEARQWRDKLTGEAHEIARGVIDPPHPDPDIQSAADALKRWAKRERNVS